MQVKDTTEALAAISRDRVVGVAKRLCSIKQPDGKEGALADVVSELLDRPRVEIHVDPVLPGRPNVIARVRGTGTGPSLVLNGHLDAFYAPNWSHDPHDPRVSQNRVYGAAASDMLGGLASMIETIIAVASLEPLAGDLVLLANMHHDSNGLGVKYALATGDEWPKYGINGEPTSSTILTAHGGCVKFEMVFTGRSAHVSRMEDGIDALAAAVEVYRGLHSIGFTHEAHSVLVGLPRLVVGEMQAGCAPGVVADQAILRGDVRTVPGMDWSTIREDLESIANRLRPPEVGLQIKCLVRQRPYIGPTSGRILDAVRAGHRVVYNEEAPINTHTAAHSFVTDAVDMAAVGIETIVYGPGAWYYRPDEYIDVDEMTNASRVYLAAALDLMGSAGQAKG